MVASSPEQGLEAARTKAPDLVLLDVMMPGISGYDMCRALQGDPATALIPIIFITARVGPDDESFGLELGAVDYITKPFNAAVVRARVRTQLRIKQQADVIESYAFRDGLTGLANRRSLDQKMEQEWLRGRRSGLPLSVALLDVDHFKLYNDHYGHGPGDECLVAVGKALGGCVRRSADLAARYGGEEFAFVLPDTDAAAALQLAEKVRAAVDALALPHARSSVTDHVTVSVGVASTVPDLSNHSAFLWTRADENLYVAKREGRNRVRG